MYPSDHVKRIVEALPESPGCYQYLDDAGNVIYVGKAKSLKRRVASYFLRDVDSRKTRALVTRIRDVKYVVVRTEQDALLLENALIKRYKPHYNVLLKDDKTYPWVAVTHEPFPRIFPTRRRTEKGADFYGPFPHVGSMHALLDVCRKLFHPRPCRQPLTLEGVQEGRYEVCLDFHIGRCSGVCRGLESPEAYGEKIAACRELLKGRTSRLLRSLKEQMYSAASRWEYERAEELKRQVALIEQYQARSEVVPASVGEVDVFSIEKEGNVAFLNFLHVQEGCINQAFTFEYRCRLEEDEKELLRLGVIEMRERYASEAHEIIVPFEVDLPEAYVQQTVPQRGDKRKLLELSRLNVKQYRFDRLKRAEKLNPEQRSVRLMREIQRDLGLQSLPLRIELFDNSHLAGSDAVSVCVVFEKLKPSKKDYRRYALESTSAGDDVGAMREVARRRYGRMKAEGTPLPDLVIADGGVGQMHALEGVLHDELGLEVAVAGLAKDARHRTRAFLTGEPPAEVGLKPESQLFRTLTAMQDEVHRFAIRFHRERRSKRAVASELDGIRGVGPATKKALLTRFGSVSGVKSASEEDFFALLGEKRGKSVFEAVRGVGEK